MVFMFFVEKHIAFVRRAWRLIMIHIYTLFKRASVHGPGFSWSKVSGCLKDPNKFMK